MFMNAVMVSGKDIEVENEKSVEKATEGHIEKVLRK
jgi:hypothetical protein